MKPASLLAAAAVVLTANAVTLIHVAWNRRGSGEGEIVLVNHELHLSFDGELKITPGLMDWELADSKLREIGLKVGPPTNDCEPGSDLCDQFDDRLGRRCVVALAVGDLSTRASPRCWLGTLTPIDVAPDPATLRARYPDRRRVVLAPAVVHYGGSSNPGRSMVSLTVLWSIYVPQPVRKKLESLYHSESWEPGIAGQPCPKPFCRVHLRYGRLLEPWLERIEFAPTHTSPTLPGAPPGRP